MVLNMKRWVGKVAVVTGASAGCGAAITKRLLEENVKVVGLARRKEKIQEISRSNNLFALQVDLTKEEDILRAFKWVKDNLGPIHILINCAGILRMTNYLDGETSMWKDMMNVNFIALSITTREAIKDMRANNVDGHIIQINDIGGYKLPGIPLMNVYCATKFSVTAAVEAVRVELTEIGSKIKISCINPGYVKTDALKAAALVQPEMGEILKEFDDNNVALEADDIADTTVFLLSTPPLVQVHEITVRPVGENF